MLRLWPMHDMNSGKHDVRRTVFTKHGNNVNKKMDSKLANEISDQ